MEKETVLEIEFMPVWDKWAWRITKWTLEVDEVFPFLNNVFRKYGLNFYFHLHILEEPISQDELISDYVKKSMEKGIKIINEKYGKSKRGRAGYKERYFYINFVGEIRENLDENNAMDRQAYAFGNYFRTEEQAEKALEKVKKALQEVEETIDLVEDYGYSEQEAKEIIKNEDKIEAIFEEWVWENLDSSWKVLGEEE